MKITYQSDGKEKTVSYIEGHWEGDDFALVGLLNVNVSAVIGRFEYFPTVWHRVKAVADFLKGTLDTPEPTVENNPGVIY